MLERPPPRRRQSGGVRAVRKEEPMEFQIASHRIWLEDGEGREAAFVSFPARDEGTVEIMSTVVSDALRGQGVAGALCRL